jgi:stage II sporulation protein D
MRVLLFGNRTECVVSAPDGFTAADESHGIQAGFSDTSEPVRIRFQNGKIHLGDLRMDGPVVISPRQPYIFFIDGQGYRGNLVISAAEDPNSFSAVNHVPLESYLLGVVGAEMYSYWEPQALQAQAIIARTYALYVKSRFGRNRSWDVTTTQANQVYRGLAAETATVRQAVEATQNQVLTCGGDGIDAIFPTYYSSTCGGHTEDSRNVFGDTFAPLGGVPCPYCEPIARERFWSWGPVGYSLPEIQQKLFARYPGMAEKLDEITSVELVRFGQIGRVVGVSVFGKNGKKDFLRGEDFRLALDSSGMKLKSTVFTMTRQGIVYTFSDGRGFGHGVGLCQTGAENMARQGKTVRDILNWYYPGAQITVLPDMQ